MSLGYVSFVKYFIIAPNIDQNTGLGFTLHVYGSLIFFAAAIIPSLFFIKNGLLRIIYVFSFIIAAVLSGRTALILFVFLGLSTIFLYLKK
jgi:membrane protein implicated in regulation of membrane protease activity